MALKGDHGPLTIRRSLTEADASVRHFSARTPNGRDYTSASYEVDLPTTPKAILGDELQKNGISSVICVNVEPTDAPLPTLNNIAHYECLTQYFNKTRRNIRVIDRHNVSFTLQATNARNFGDDDHFVVRKIHRFNNAEIAKSVLANHEHERHLLCVEDGERHEVLRKIKELIDKGDLRSHSSQVSITVDRIIPIALFQTSVGLYVTDIDNLLVVDNLNIGTMHPLSLDAQAKGEIIKLVGARRLTGALFEIIDNSNNFESRYVCLGKNVIQIPINRDPGKRTGVYHTHIDNVNSSEMRISLEYSAPEDAEKLGIFKTREEAETRGHLNDSLKAQLVQMDLSLEELKRKNRQLELQRTEALGQAEHERKLREAQISRHELELKHEARKEDHQLERVSAVRKDYYEDRAAFRNDSSALLKWAPAIITTLVTVGAIAVMKSGDGKTKFNFF